MHEKGKKEAFQDAVRRHLRALDEAEGISTFQAEEELPALQRTRRTGEGRMQGVGEPNIEVAKDPPPL